MDKCKEMTPTCSTCTLFPLPNLTISSPSLGLLKFLNACKEFVTWIVALVSNHQELEGASMLFDSKQTRAKGLPSSSQAIS